MLITCGGNVVIRDSAAATALFTQHGAPGRAFRMLYEVFFPGSVQDCFIRVLHQTRRPFLRHLRGLMFAL